MPSVNIREQAKSTHAYCYIILILVHTNTLQILKTFCLMLNFTQVIYQDFFEVRPVRHKELLRYLKTTQAKGLCN